MALPGLTIVTSHDWLGCPVIPTEWGSPANAILLSAPYKAAPAIVIINLVFTSMNRNDRRRASHRKSNALVTFADSRRVISDDSPNISRAAVQQFGSRT